MQAEGIRELEKASLTGETFEALLRTREWAILKEEILEPMYHSAFEAFTKVDPADSLQVIQTQQMGKVVLKIEELINQKINNGRGARLTLASLSEQEE